MNEFCAHSALSRSFLSVHNSILMVVEGGFFLSKEKLVTVWKLETFSVILCMRILWVSATVLGHVS